MNAEGLGRLFARDQMVEGPFPEHYEPFESPSENALHPKVRSNPAARVFANDMAVFGEKSDFPYVATTYRLTEHFHFWTKHALINAILQPEEFIEIGEILAKEKGIEQGGWVRVSSKRGFVVCKAYVTQAHSSHAGGWQCDACDRRAPALGVHRPGAEGIRRQYADALGR